MLALDMPLTIVTNSLSAAEMCGKSSRLRVIVVGGTLRNGSATLWGEPGQGFLSTLQADLCLLGVCSLDLEAGLGGMDHEEALVKRRMAACAGRVAAVVTADKLGTAAPFPILPVDRLNALITERAADAALLAAYRKAGLTLFLA